MTLFSVDIKVDKNIFIKMDSDDVITFNSMEEELNHWKDLAQLYLIEYVCLKKKIFVKNFKFIY